MTSFRNFGFEDGTIAGWTKGGGAWGGGAAPAPADYLPGGSFYDLSYAEVTVTSAGTDARTDNTLSTVYDGAHAVMVNAAAANQSVSVMSQAIADYTGSSISFAYAAVLQQSHDTGEADGFSVVLTDTTTGETLYEVDFDSSTAAGGFTLSSSGWYYQDWSRITVDTSTHRGDDFLLSVVAHDCSLGGHAGYVYFDGFDFPIGKIAGTVFHDYDGGGTRDPKEPELAGWTVYVDSDGDGVRDSGEASAVTDTNGRYVLSAVPIGTVAVRVDVPTGTWEAWAAQPVSVTVEDGATTRGTDLAVTGGATPFDDVLRGVGRAAETIDGLGGNDAISGRAGDDTITGGAGDDLLRGGYGDNRLDGGLGDDRVRGGDGADLVTGGAGADVLTGRLGADTFLFADRFGDDTILDFSSAEGDKIKLAVAGVGTIDDLVFTQHGQSTVITLAAGGTDAIHVRGVLPAGLSDADFVFAPPPAAAAAWHEGVLAHLSFADAGLLALV